MPTPEIGGQPRGRFDEDQESYGSRTYSGPREGKPPRARAIWDRVRKFGSTPGAGLILAILACGAIAGYSLWYVSAGRFPDFPHIQNDYVDLGEAFLHGQTALLEAPDPQLAMLGNPYDYSQRKNIPVHWDASYYDGR